MGVGRLAARIVIGGIFVGHGLQKLTGAFGGSGPEGTEQMMAALKLEPAKYNAIASGATEAGCGALLVAGAATPFAAAGLIGTMVTAIRTVHGPKGPWNSDGGWEYNSVLIASLMALVDAGPGPASLDAATGQVRNGSRWALAALAIGATASTVVVALGRNAAHAKQLADEAAPQ